MGSIVSSGVGSGLDTASIVKSLVEAEGGPKTLRLNAEEAKVQAKMSALVGMSHISTGAIGSRSSPNG